MGELKNRRSLLKQAGLFSAGIFTIESSASYANTPSNADTLSQLSANALCVAILQFQSVEDLVNGTLSDGTSLTDVIDLEEWVNQRPMVRVLWNNSTSKLGGANYVIWKIEDYRKEIENESWVPDGFTGSSGNGEPSSIREQYLGGDHYCFTGDSKSYVAILNSASGDPTMFGAVPNTAADDEQINQENVTALNKCFSYFRAKVVDGGNLHYNTSGPSPIYWYSLTAVKNFRVTGYSETANTVESKSMTLPPSHSNYTRDVKAYNVWISSIYNNAVVGRWWQCAFELSSFKAKNGCSLWFVGDAYSTGNKVLGCHFYGFKKAAIYASTGIRKPTDMTINDNRFYSSEADSKSHILLEGVSGTSLSQNHYFGKASEYFINIKSGGSSVRITEEYFEQNSKGSGKHIYISGGNNATYVIHNNAHWVDADLDGAVIDVGLNYLSKISYDGNIFHSSKKVKVFDFIGSTPATEIAVGGVNRAERGFADDAFGKNCSFQLESTHPAVLSDRYCTISGFMHSLYLYTSRSNQTGAITFASNEGDIPDKFFTVANVSPLTTIALQLNSGFRSRGYSIVGKQTLGPSETAKLYIKHSDKIIYSY